MVEDSKTVEYITAHVVERKRFLDFFEKYWSECLIFSGSWTNDWMDYEQTSTWTDVNDSLSTISNEKIFLRDIFCYFLSFRFTTTRKYGGHVFWYHVIHQD